MTNFDFLKSDPQFATFSDVAISAEKILNIDAAASVLNCRRAMEFAVKWMYSVDKDLEMPYDTTLITLMSSEDFRDVVGNDIYRRMDFIRKVGNIAAHGGKKISMEQAKLCIENLEAYDWQDNEVQYKKEIHTVASHQLLWTSARRCGLSVTHFIHRR